MRPNTARRFEDRPGPKPPAILVVDDEEGIRSSLGGALADEGFRVIEARDGRDALMLIEREKPALVILDIWMPEIDGIEVLRRIKGSDPSTPVIVISGHGNIETAVTATKLGAFDFVEKPFSLEGLLGVVERALRAAAEREGSAMAEEQERPAAGGRRGTGAPVPGGRWRESTISRSVVANGQGLHSGIRTGLILQPMPPGTGILFESISEGKTIPARVEFVDSTGYATTLYHEGTVVRTIEHLMAALHAYRITNVLVKMQGEIPILDGSALEFCDLLESAGRVEQVGEVSPLVIDRRYEIGERSGSGKYIAIEPADCFCVDYTLDYPPPIGKQHLSYRLEGSRSFREEIAPARTFGFVREIEALAKVGLASGGRLDNCILVGDSGVVNTELRFPDEFVRHKILDLIGDMYLLGRPICGKVTARMTGHTDNVALLRLIRDARRPR